MADLALPRGPLTQHLQAAHRLMAAQCGPGSVHEVAAHAHHLQAVAEYTADRPRQAGPTPPRPEPVTDADLTGKGGREGWDRLVVAPDGTVLAGWTTEGDFHAWSPTEVIARTLCDTVMTALNITLGGHDG